jgi:hypothetical protein
VVDKAVRAISDNMEKRNIQASEKSNREQV